MEIAEIIPHLEALIFASEKPLTSMELTELINNAFGFMEEKLTLEQVQTALEGIIEKYSAAFYPFEVRESGGGWQFLTKKEFHKTVGQLNGEKFLKRLSSAALETLAIIAYKQPITKGEIESIRGVSSDYSIQKLLEKELIIIAGRNENMVGKPLIYTTSKTFMDYFGLNSPGDLPKLKEVFADTLAEPTLVSGLLEGAEPAAGSEEGSPEPGFEEEGPVSGEIAGQDTESASITLIISENGELVENEQREAREQQETEAEGTASEETEIEAERTEAEEEQTEAEEAFEDTAEEGAFGEGTTGAQEGEGEEREEEEGGYKEEEGEGGDEEEDEAEAKGHPEKKKRGLDDEDPEDNEHKV
ncbi:MAG: SMC-Scp complex subunit ScpB [Puia sp.]|nr:SMC-Scp complex subunit ScpB [Puia sp.]